MEMQQIRYFLAACEHLNFTRAAEEENISQPALTRAIQKLEEELGGELFRRERSRTHLTTLAIQIRPYLEIIAVQVKAAGEVARATISLERARLEVGIMTTVGPLRFSTFLKHFQHIHPGIELWVHEGNLPDLTQRLINGELDVAVLSSPVPLPSRIDSLPLYEERFVVIMPERHPLVQSASVTLDDLAKEPYLDRLSCEYREIMIELWTRSGKNMNPVYRSDRDDWIQGMVLAGNGLAILPEYAITASNLTCRLLTDPRLTRSLKVCSVAGRRFSSAVAAFMRELKTYRWTNSII